MPRKIQLIQNPALQLGKSIYRGRLNAENYIDMGLPSGTKWAAANLDITTESKLAESPFQYKCSFFSWGNIEGHNPIDETTFEYNFGNANPAAPWYEGQPYGSTPGSTLTENIPISDEFDAARALLGDPWRTPSNIEFNELFANSIFIDADGVEVPAQNVDKRVTVNGIIGLYLQSKTNGNRLFLPCSGYATGTRWNKETNYATGDYWTKNYTSDRDAHLLAFRPDGIINPINYSDKRSLGLTIRAVMN